MRLARRCRARHTHFVGKTAQTVSPAGSRAVLAWVGRAAHRTNPKQDPVSAVMKVDMLRRSRIPEVLALGQQNGVAQDPLVLSARLTAAVQQGDEAGALALWANITVSLLRGRHQADSLPSSGVLAGGVHAKCHGLAMHCYLAASRQKSI